MMANTSAAANSSASDRRRMLADSAAASAPRRGAFAPRRTIRAAATSAAPANAALMVCAHGKYALANRGLAATSQNASGPARGSISFASNHATAAAAMNPTIDMKTNPTPMPNSDVAAKSNQAWTGWRTYG